MPPPFQSTLSRGERPPFFPKEAIGDKISIHALTRRAARFFSSSPIDCCDFNPRSHEESGVRRNLTKLKVLLFQSTLSRGERLWQSLPEHWEQKFQSTLSRGERRLANLIWVINLRFQSTLSRGERHPSNQLFFSLANFNPRSHEESGAGDYLDYT